MVVLHAAGDQFCASEDPQSWMAGAADLQISFEATVAAYYQVVSACSDMLSRNSQSLCWLCCRARSVELGLLLH